MKKSRRLAVVALGLSLGLAGVGPAAMAHRPTPPTNPPPPPPPVTPPPPDVEAEGDCSTDMDNSSDNSTGSSQQSGLINVNNIALQGLNLDLLGNLLCQGVFLNDIVGSVLGTVLDLGGLGGGDSTDDDGSCTTEMDNTSTNSTGNSAQDGLINVNNIALQGLNLDVLGNALCQADFLNDLNVAVLGTILDGDGDGDGAASAGSESEPECSTDMSNDSDNSTGNSVMGGLLNINNIALQGLNVPVLSNGLCGSIFLNDILVSILGIL